MANTVELVFGADQVRTTNQVISDLQKIAKRVEASGATKLKFALDTSETSSAAQSIQAQAQSISGSLSSSVSRYSKQLVQYYKDLDNQNTAFNQKNLNGIDYEIRQREIAAKKFSTQLQAQMQQEQTAATASEKASKKQQQADHSRENDLLQYRKVLAQVESQYNRYSDNIQKNSGLNANYQTVISKLKSGIETGKFDFKDVTDARTQVARLDNTLTETGGKVETFTQKLKNLFGIHLTTALTMVGIHALVQGLNQVYDNVVKLDEAVVNLQVATGYSREQTQALISDYSKYAKELGATTTQVAEAGNDWLRQGYSVEQANTLIKDSMMLSKLGQIDSATSTQNLTSAMKGYKLSVNDVLGVVDKLTKVDMSAAVSSSFISQAMSETATSARLAGVSMDQLIGYIASVGEVTQDSAESVGEKYCLAA